MNPLRGANHEFVGKSNEHAKDNRHNKENPAEYEQWEYFVAEGIIACESFDVVRQGAFRVINYENKEITQEDVADVHDARPQDPWHGAWERIESTLTCRNDEGGTLFTEPDIALLQHVSLAVVQGFFSRCRGLLVKARPARACRALLRGVLVLCAHDIPLYRVENPLLPASLYSSSRWSSAPIKRL